MHVSTKKLTFLGLLLAVTVILTVLGSYVEISTFFFLAAASYLVGVALVETNVEMGIGFYVASVFLCLILSPNKIYCLTFAVMAAYLVIIEVIRRFLTKREMKHLAILIPNEQRIKKQRVIFWSAKFVVFNLLYLPVLYFFPKLIYPGKLSTSVVLGLLVGGQFGLVIYDVAYQEFIVKYWSKVRKNLPF